MTERQAYLRFDDLRDYLRGRRPARVFVLDSIEAAELSQKLQAEGMPPLAREAVVVKLDHGCVITTCFIVLMLVGFGYAGAQFWSKGNSWEHWTSMAAAATVLAVIMGFFGYFLLLSFYACLYFVFEPDRIHVRRRFVFRSRTNSFALASITGIVKRKGYGPKFAVWHVLDILHDGMKTEVFMDPDTSPIGKVAWFANLLGAATGFRVTDHTVMDRTKT